MVVGWIPSPQTPLAFGGPLICGYDGDTWTGDVPLALFGPGSISLAFQLPNAQTAIKVSVPALQVGAPAAPLVLALFSPGGALLGSISVPAASVSATIPDWIPFQSFTGSFAPGLYKVVVSSPSSTSTAYYRGFINFATSWWDPTAKAGYVPASPSFGGNSGSSVVWVQDSAGNDLALLPFGDVLVPAFQMQFVAEANYSVSCICPWMSDMEFQFKAYNIGWTLQDLTAGTTLGSAQASQVYDSHGIFGVIPFQLPAPVSLIQGHTYQVSITGNPTFIYGILLRGNSVNPAKAAPGGVNPFWWGELALADFSAYRALDYVNNHILIQGTNGSIGGPQLVGVRFASAGGTLQSVHLKMYNTSLGGNYPAGIPVTVSVYASNDSANNNAGATPAGNPLASVTVDSGTIPTNGWFDVLGFNFAMQPNTAYWIVWSAPSGGTYVPQRCVSPFRNLLQVSPDAGTTWQYPNQGPSDIAWYGLVSGSQYIGSPYDHVVTLPISPTSLVAQPFVLSKPASVGSVFVVPTGGGVVRAAVYPDDGTGTKPNLTASLGSGSFDTTFQYFYSGVIVPFGNSVTPVLQAGTKYWLVLSNASAGMLIGAAYWTRPSDPSVPAGYEVLISSNGGASWTQADPEVATSVFMVGAQQGTVPPPPVPTTLSLTARIL